MSQGATERIVQHQSADETHQMAQAAHQVVAKGQHNAELCKSIQHWVLLQLGDVVLGLAACEEICRHQQCAAADQCNAGACATGKRQRNIKE